MKTESQVLNIPIEDIIPNRFQPRLNFDDSGLEELSASIKQHGVIQPLVVRRTGDKFEIIAGERRYKASKMAGLTSVPAIVATLDDKQSAELAIAENVQRRDLSAIEEAKSYESLVNKGYLTKEELAKKMGISLMAVENKLKLLTLSDEVQKALMEGKISERHARSLLQLDSKEEQNKWLNTILEERITVKELDNRLKKISSDGIEELDVPEEISKNDENMDNNMNTDTETNEVLNPEEQPMPNKFFNFLEDEQANMNTGNDKVRPAFEIVPPTQIQAPEYNEVEVLDTNPNIIEPVPNPNVLPPEPVVNNVEPGMITEPNIVDIPNIDPINEINNSEAIREFEKQNHFEEKEEKETEEENSVNITLDEEEFESLEFASHLMDKMKTELKKHKYSIVFLEEDNDKELKYTITIKKK